MIDLTTVGVSNHEEGVSGGLAWQNSPQTGLRVLEGMERRMALVPSEKNGLVRITLKKACPDGTIAVDMDPRQIFRASRFEISE